MEIEELTQRLLAAEMRYAHFNAQRTSVGSDDGRIERGTDGTFEYLLDPGRPANAYYNRAVGRAPDAISRATLAALPRGIVGLETTPAQVDTQTAALLAGFGFEPASQLCYLGLAPGGHRPVAHDVRRLGPDETDRFFDLLEAEGVEFTPERRARKRGYYCTGRFQSYVAYDTQGTACGWTTMYVEEGTAFFGNSFTPPRYRGRGAHSALLAARLNAAAELGLDAAFTDVEPGSQSEANCERAGFRTLTINTIWSRAPRRET